MTPWIAHLYGVVDRWLVAPEANAAGRLGLFRIGYAVFYLWVLTGYLPAYLYNLPEHLLVAVIGFAWSLWSLVQASVGWVRARRNMRDAAWPPSMPPR